MTKVTINVTQEHINRGIRGSADRCPIALATKEAIPCPLVTVALRIALRDSPMHAPYAEFKLPPWALSWVDYFDDDPQSVGPITLEATFTPIE
jgi:hypothetical protein